RAVAVAYDADVAAGGRREGVALELEGLPAALAGEDRGPGDGVERHLDVEGRDAGVAHVPGDVHLIKGCDRTEVVADPLAVALRRPAGGEVAVNGILGDVAIIRARGHGNQGKRETGRAEDVCLSADAPPGGGQVAVVAPQGRGAAGGWGGVCQVQWRG